MGPTARECRGLLVWHFCWNQFRIFFCQLEPELLVKVNRRPEMARRSNLLLRLPSDHRLQITVQITDHKSQVTVHRHCSRDWVKLLPSKVRTMVPARAETHVAGASEPVVSFACLNRQFDSCSICMLALLGWDLHAQLPRREQRTQIVRFDHSIIRPLGSSTTRPLDHSIIQSGPLPSAIVPPSSRHRPASPTLWPRRSR
jgi:hypothetical protein